MNYQHCFHAGNFADIIKHSILIWCLEKLHEKNSNFLAIDTHAGAGKYQLKDQQILPNSEAYNGIKKILADKNFQNILPNNFLKILAKINVCEIEQLPNKFNFYPGSPLLIKNFLRINDRAIFVEKSEAIFNQLKRNFAGNKKIFCEKNDGYNLLKSKLPPIQKRAIILLDPSYEKFSQKISPDYHLVIDSLAQSYQRFANGIYLLWIPIIDHQQNLIDEFYSKIKELKFNEILQVVFDIGIEIYNKIGK
jgi:23S rRNA (adenine2030-N6)-methyltransferase